MSAKITKKIKTASVIQNRASNINLQPLTPDQAMAALLKVKLSDVKKLEAAEKSAKSKR